MQSDQEQERVGGVVPRLSPNVCHDCGTSGVKGSRCPPCRERHRLQERKRKERLRDEGRCIFCGDLLGERGRTLCGRCCARKRALRREMTYE